MANCGRQALEGLGGVAGGGMEKEGRESGVKGGGQQNSRRELAGGDVRRG